MDSALKNRLRLKLIKRVAEKEKIKKFFRRSYSIIKMGKAKKNLSAKMRAKGQKKQEINPFEMKTNKQRHVVMGQKLGKHARGMPAQSKSNSIKKRMETLLVEYQKHGKSNNFLDKRIGEKNPNMTEDDKKLRRFQLARKSQPSQPLFNLADDEEEEELTHFGQSLSQIEKFEDPIISDDDSDDGRIPGNIVAEEHFGGGFLSRKQDGQNKDEKFKSAAEKTAEIVFKSLLEKNERRKEKNEMQIQREELDKKSRSLLPQLSQQLAKYAEKPREKPDDLDIKMRKLMFEPKGTPSNRLKTEEEIAKEEKEKLDKLEEDRIRRMKGIVKVVPSKSADDLDDDGFYLQENNSKDDETDEEDDDESGDDESGGDDDDDDNDKSGDDDDDDKSGDDDDDEDDEGDDDDDAMKNMSDIASSDEEKDGEKADDKIPSVKPAKKSVRFVDGFVEPSKEITIEGNKEEMEAASKEVPYTFKAPETYEDLLNLFNKYKDHQILIVDRLQKCFHKSLADGNINILERLFSFLVKYVGELVVRDIPEVSLANQFVSPLYSLCKISPIFAGKVLQETIFSHQADYLLDAERRNGKGQYPGLDVIIHLKLVAVLFPTSDLRHPVVTPAMLFMGQILSQSIVTCEKDIAYGLFICSLFLEYVSLSKRFIPEVINYLSGVLFMASEKSQEKLKLLVAPFKDSGKNTNLLKLNCSEKSQHKVSLPMKITVCTSSGQEYTRSEDFRVDCLALCLQLATRFADLYKPLSAFKTIFHPVRCFASKISLDLYPDEVETLHSTLMVKTTSDSKFKHLVRAFVRPQPLKMFDPIVEEKFDGRKKTGGSREFKARQRDLAKYKKAYKGSEREIRKDQRFLQEYILKEKVNKNKEREEKTKKILSSLANQEGEFKAMMKSQKRKKNDKDFRSKDGKPRDGRPAKKSKK